MPMKTICFGFDGICADMSFIIPDLPKYQEELIIKYPFLEPIFDLLLAEQPQDGELQFETTEMGFETFFDLIFTLNEISHQKTTRIGANAAIETVTALNLINAPVYPIKATRIYFLGNYSTEVSQKLPKEHQIFQTCLDYANQVKTSYIPISIILPYHNKRGIISFAGMPNIRRVETLRTYLQTLGGKIKDLNPDLMAIVGATNVYATTTNFDDFKLLNPFLNLRNTLIDLGGTIGWSNERLKHFYELVNHVKLVMGNDDEFRAWYNFKFNESIQSSDPLTIFKISQKLRKENQILVCHTAKYQFVIGIEENQDIVRDCMKFANQATVVKSEMEAFPTAEQVIQMPLKESSIHLPAILEKETIFTRSVDKEIMNPVGLGDVWTASFSLGLLSQNIF
ncbi:MAG: hypothetical protein ACTSRS_02440 [Candidatus Helarchaeota archaeon]